MTLRRTDGPHEALHFQSGRIARQNDEWFYMVREGSQRGPFKSKEDAEDDLTAFILYLDTIYNVAN